MKKVYSLLALALLIFLLQPEYSNAASTVTLTSSSYQVIVNGAFLNLDVPPVMDNGHLFIPIRALASLGLSYSWNPGTKVTTIQNQAHDYIKIAVNNRTASKNEKPIVMDQPAQSKDGRILVPIRFVSETLGFDVQFETIRNFVFINAKDYQTDTNVLTGGDLQAARKAAISLPIQSDFKLLCAASSNHGYSFPKGRADFYFINDEYFTYVQIINGKAYAIGQINTSDLSEVVGKVPPNVGFDDNPAMVPYNENGSVIFYQIGDGSGIAAYNDKNGKRVESKTKLTIFSDIIQPLPDQL